MGKTKGHEATSFGKKENRFDERGPIYERWPILLNGNVIQGTSLKKLLEDCEDFKNETSIECLQTPNISIFNFQFFPSFYFFCFLAPIIWK